MTNYSFADCLKQSYKINWRIDDVLGAKRFDPARRWLPDSLSAASTIGCLGRDELRKLTHVEMASYAHLFGYVEGFIAPKATELAAAQQLGDRDAFDALTNFAAEEVKHMMLFRAVRKRADETLGFESELIGGQMDTARYVLGKSNAGVLLFTAALEWLTQRHYLDAWKSAAGLDPLTKDIFRAHWLEEAQHAKMDHLETLRAFEGIGAEESDRAIDDVIELVGAVDGLLKQQSALDLANFGTYLGRTLSAAASREIYEHVHRAKRWTFIETGVTHPRFQELLRQVATPAQRDRMERAVAPLLRQVPEGAAA